MNCFVCNRDTGQHGDDFAIYEDTSGNYGSRVMDDTGFTVRLSICDWCLVERQARLRQKIHTPRCDKCGEVSKFHYDFVQVPEDFITKAEGM